jgi:prolyl oligopeptidase
MTFDYPETRRDDTVETLHGVRIEDPYRWLEDPDSDETRARVKSQNEVSRGHLDALASRPWFHEQLTAYVRRPRAGTPDKLGGRYVVTRNDGSLEQDQLYVADTLDELRAAGRILLDPNEFSDDGTSSLFDRTASKDGTLLAYLVSDGGSDWTSIRLLRLDGSEPERPFETLTNVKFSSATWLPDHSFLYLHYDVTGTGTGTDAAALPGGKLKLHRVGTPQSDDALILEFPDNARISVTPELSHDGRYVVVTIHEGTSEKNRLWVYPVETTGGRSSLGRPLKVVDETYAVFDFVRVDGDRLYLRTDHEAPLGRVVVVDLDAFPRHGLELEEVVAESESALWTAQGAGEEILTIHLVDAQPRITRHALDGSGGTVVPVEGGTVVTVNAEAGDPEVFIGTASVSSPLTPYRLDLSDGSVEEIVGLERGRSTWTAPEVVTERRRAPSLDGTEIPYFLFRRRDLDLDTPRPTLLYGYGGFNIVQSPTFSAARLALLEQGFVYASANIRGGGEYGETWHKAGMKLKKQNVFDDFIAAAEWLIANKYTSSERLAINGGSNGGLLVGAVMNQRPELFRVAVPQVGVMDMLRFHKFTIGWNWIADYGSSDDADEFAALHAYSPLHNIKAGVKYPATLITTSDHDDRVVPAHSFKYAAMLQEKASKEAPVLIRIETKSGHGASNLRKQLETVADIYAFIMHNIGVVPRGTTNDD